jgi:hypothetical protein
MAKKKTDETWNSNTSRFRLSGTAAAPEGQEGVPLKLISPQEIITRWLVDPSIHSYTLYDHLSVLHLHMASTNRRCLHLLGQLNHFPASPPKVLAPYRVPCLIAAPHGVLEVVSSAFIHSYMSKWYRTQFRYSPPQSHSSLHTPAPMEALNSLPPATPISSSLPLIGPPHCSNIYKPSHLPTPFANHQAPTSLIGGQLPNRSGSPIPAAPSVHLQRTIVGPTSHSAVLVSGISTTLSARLQLSRQSLLKPVFQAFVERVLKTRPEVVAKEVQTRLKR